MSRIFVSYARHDSACVHKVVRQIEAEGFGVWIDRGGIGKGADWRASIREVDSLRAW